METEQSVDKWKLVCRTETSEGEYVLTTRILPIPSTPDNLKGCVVHTSTVRNRANGPLISEALTFVPGVGPKHFGI